MGKILLDGAPSYHGEEVHVYQRHRGLCWK